jgi:uncharacterized protein (TIGR01777 family)
MKVVIGGGSGFLGTTLAGALASRSHEIVVLTRHASGSGGPARRVQWDPDGSAAGDWIREIDGADAVVNLSGAGIADRRWTAARKQVLRDSRVLPTRSLVAAVRAAARRPATFLQGSAIGFYGPTADELLDESFPPGSDFFGGLAVAWEAEALPAAALGCRLVVIRSAVVLTRHGGALKKMLPPFQFFVGGPIASGRQYFSWIHRDDWTALFVWALENPSVTGVLNGSAPEPVTNEVFSKALGRALHRPSWFRVPGFMLRMLFGEMANAALINGQRVVPKRALDQGFQFKYPTIDAALQNI